MVGMAASLRQRHRRRGLVIRPRHVTTFGARRVGATVAALIPTMADSREVVTVSETVWVERDRAAVFDYTQDYTRRMEWDRGIQRVEVLATDPRTVRVRMAGLGEATVVYRLDRRPERTSAAFIDVVSRWVSGGGGSWQYEDTGGGTRWQQTNSLELRDGWLPRLMRPVIRTGLRRSMRASMSEAKRRLEASAPTSTDDPATP
jgi:hypothetical protein